MGPAPEIMSWVTASRPRAQRGPVWVRVIFVLAVLLIPAQAFVKVTSGREPYPALIQPAFGYAANALTRPDVIRVVVAEVEVTFTDGSISILTPDELLPWTAGISATTILTKSFITREPAGSTVQWLVDRISAARPSQTATGAQVRLYAVSIDARTLHEVERTVTDQVSLSFPGKS